MLALPTELDANFVLVTAPELSFAAVTEKSVIAVVVTAFVAMDVELTAPAAILSFLNLLQPQPFSLN